MNPPPARPPVFTIALLSASALAYEVLLVRLFSIIQWHHFAYMIISLALLGYGASGTFLALAQRWLLPRFNAVFLANIGLFGVAAVGCYALAQTIPFNAEEVLWDWRQPLRLMLIYLLLSLPFFFAANAIALVLMRYRDQMARVYGADLTGAGLGALGAIGLLLLVFPLTALTVLGALGLLAAGLAVWELGLKPRVRFFAPGLIVLVALVVGGSGLGLNLSPYKSLSQTLRLPGAKVIAERSSPLGLISVVETKRRPLRHAPGLSLTATAGPPMQLGVFTDGDGMTAITDVSGGRRSLAYLDRLTWAAPYHLLRPQRVLILGAGGGSEVMQARYHDVPRIDAVELNPQIVDLMRRDYRDYTGGLYDTDGVRIHIAEARGFVASTTERYDLIQVALVDAYGASATGLYALNESYLYTVEALQAYLRLLKPGGFLALSRWVKMPPRDTLKLFATAVTALERSGVKDAGRRLLLIRGWQTSTLLIKSGRVTKPEIRALRRFAAKRAFDVAYYPGIGRGMANRYNILRQPYFYLGARAMLGEGRADFLARYKFDLTPATDDRPYFFHFFKWRVVPEILALRGKGGLPLLEWGYLVLVATLVQALVASAILILLPLWAYRRQREVLADVPDRTRVVVYFFAVGLAFLFIEIAFIQKFILFLHHPLYAVAVVLSAFLVFAGLGSRWSRRWADGGYRTGAGWAVAGIIGLGGLYALALGPVFDLLIAWPVWVKVPVAVMLIAPLGFCMGMPFPLALAAVGDRAPALIPWAWGINGCASVISAVLATLLAIHFGFTIVVLLALGGYALAWSVFPSRAHHSPT
jgi:spermidine synthase